MLSRSKSAEIFIRAKKDGAFKNFGKKYYSIEETTLTIYFQLQSKFGVHFHFPMLPSMALFICANTKKFVIVSGDVKFKAGKSYYLELDFR